VTASPSPTSPSPTSPSPTSPSPTSPSPTRTCRFGPLVVEFDDRVLTPRPWTLQQSNWAAEIAARLAAGPILELCAGAGHIGLAAAVLADRDLVQVEAEPIAAGYARANAARAGWANRAEVRIEAFQTALRDGEVFPVILADPPYLPTAEIAHWPEDPRSAIDGGPTGLDLIEDCLTVAAAHLAPAGRLLLQVAGTRQVAEVGRLLRDAPSPSLRVEDLRVIDDERAIMCVRAGNGGVGD
jgi:methylase of polypeptide subunit release factors